MAKNGAVNESIGKRVLFFVLFALAASSAAAGCTSLGMEFDDPFAMVVLAGEPFESCSGGKAFYSGRAQNVGTVDVENVTARIDVFGDSGSRLGRFTTTVSKGVDTEDEISVVNNTLEVGESGTFHLKTSVNCPSAARAEYTFSFTAARFEEVQ